MTSILHARAFHAGLRIDGIPTSDSSQKIQASRNRWREEVNNQASRIQVRNETQSTVTITRKKRHNNREVDELSIVDHFVTNANSSQGEAQLYIFEDNEAEIKMTIKSRSPTMRHVSRTHKVALDWLFDRVILDPKIQIKHVHTKNQLADMSTEGTFALDEWNHPLRLFNIMNFPMFLAAISTMSKRAQMNLRLRNRGLHVWYQETC